MIAGNLPPEEEIQLDYVEKYPPPFKISKYERKIILRPYQTLTLDSTLDIYIPLDIDCPQIEIDYNRLRKEGFPYWDSIINTNGAHETVLWIDPKFLSTECLASIIINWQKSLVSKNVILAIVVPKGSVNQKKEKKYEIWKVDPFTIINSEELSNPVWYPSLAREKNALIESLEHFQPYDLFPLIEFPFFATQMGERTLTDHADLLEQTRTRTRNFIYLDIVHPRRAFLQFYGILRALPKKGSSVFQPVITPGGDIKGFLVSLLAGVLTNSFFLTPIHEIPIDSYLEVQGIIILRKIT